MKKAIRTRALELGFDDCRFASAMPPATADRFRRWLDTSQHGQMTYLARNAHKRVDPRQVLPGVRSVVCVALNYGPGREVRSGIERRGLLGLVARYARHDDYHETMGQRLSELAAFIGQQGGERTRSLWYVDTGPILEREYAQRAGVGFVGKHTNVISRRFGNWILLGEILTTLELESDAAEKNRCGRCTRCITACPTGAITAPFQLDARLCISYLTIELKGSIPETLRPAIGRRIFGCDDCLEVCPWNRFAADARLIQQHRRTELESPDLLQLLSLDAAAFRKHFQGTPLERSKRRGLLRNVCVALGNIGGAESLPALKKATADAEPLVAEHAQWATDSIEKRLKAVHH